MDLSTPTRSTWIAAALYGLGAYSIHKTGVILGWYYDFFWFQLLTHFLSATALALLLLLAGRTLGLSGRRLLTFVVVGAAVGALSWELVEYLKIFPWLIWWGPADSFIDLVFDALGVSTVLLLDRARGHGPELVAGGYPTSDPTATGRE